MTLSDEMSRIAGTFEAAQAARSAAVTGIAAAVRRELRRSRASLQRLAAAQAKARDLQLKGIFSEAAFVRGAATDLIEGFKSQRARSAEALSAELEGYVSALHQAVDKLLSDLASARATMAKRESDLREVYLQDLRRRVEKALAETSKYVEGLYRDCTRAQRVWAQHLRTQKRIRHEAAKRPEPEAARRVAEAAKPAVAEAKPAVAEPARRAPAEAPKRAETEAKRAPAHASATQEKGEKGQSTASFDVPK